VIIAPWSGRSYGRVEDAGEIVGAAFDIVEGRGHRRCAIDDGARAVRAERFDMRDLRGDRGSRELFFPPGIADEDSRLGVGQEIFDLGRRIGGVERQEGRAGARAAEIEQHGLKRFLDLHGDAVARLHAERDQRAGHARGASVDVGIGMLRAVLRLEGDLAAFRKALGELAVEMRGHGEIRSPWLLSAPGHGCAL